MSDQGKRVEPTQRRYSQEQKDQAVRLVRRIRAETGQSFGAVKRVAEQLATGSSRCGRG
jgi:transposase